MMGKSLKVSLGGSAIAVANSSFLHSDPVRILLIILILAGVCVTIFLYLIWNGRHLRNPPEAWSVVW
jgi:hypothetical protein